MEDLPSMSLNMGERGEFEATPENTSLFNFLGHLACYNHVFIQLGDEDEETMTGTYVFSTHPVYRQMAEYMMQNGYPMHLNLRQVAECDQNAFNRMVEQQASTLDDELDQLLGGEHGTPPTE